MGKNIKDDQVAIAIDISLKIVAVSVCLVTGAYYAYFQMYLDAGASADPAIWGAFGDFVGGLLGPVVAFAAFLLLAKSLQLQHTELRKTSEALKQASEAQGEQVNVQKAAATMNALSTVIASADQQVGILARELEVVSKTLIEGVASRVDGKTIYQTEAAHVEEELLSRISQLQRARKNYVHRLGMALGNAADGDEGIAELMETKIV